MDKNFDYRNQIEAYVPKSRQEENDKRVILKYVDEFEDSILFRENEFAHISSSGMIVNQNFDKVLMVYHNIYHSWSWTGGHADGDKNLLKVAVKEAMEETGITHIHPIHENIVALDILPVWGHIKRDKYVSGHLHLNVSYSLIANDKDELKIKEDENSGVQWLEIAKLSEYVSEPDMLPVYTKIIHQILESRNL